MTDYIVLSSHRRKLGDSFVCQGEMFKISCTLSEDWFTIVLIKDSHKLFLLFKSEECFRLTPTVILLKWCRVGEFWNLWGLRDHNYSLKLIHTYKDLFRRARRLHRARCLRDFLVQHSVPEFHSLRVPACRRRPRDQEALGSILSQERHDLTLHRTEVNFSTTTTIRLVVGQSVEQFVFRGTGGPT